MLLACGVLLPVKILNLVSVVHCVTTQAYNVCKTDEYSSSSTCKYLYYNLKSRGCSRRSSGMLPKTAFLSDRKHLVIVLDHR